MYNEGSPGQWPLAATIFKQHIGSPLRPVLEDLQFLQVLLDRWFFRTSRPLRVLILGVTPEYYHFPWPAKTELRAIDKTREMIDHVWPGPKESVSHTDWLDLQSLSGTFDIVLCDGGLHLLDFPRSQNSLAKLLADRINARGFCFMRLFTPPERKETTEQVLSDLFAGNIPDLNCLKLRLGNALQKSPEDGACLDNIWRTLHAAAPDQEDLAGRLGWSIDDLRAINTYRGSQARYHFVTLGQVIETFVDGTGGLFSVESVEWPMYFMGDQCPTVSFRRK